jgi:hypothetical protein
MKNSQLGDQHRWLSYIAGWCQAQTMDQSGGLNRWRDRAGCGWVVAAKEGTWKFSAWIWRRQRKVTWREGSANLGRRAHKSFQGRLGASEAFVGRPMKNRHGLIVYRGTSCPTLRGASRNAVYEISIMEGCLICPSGPDSGAYMAGE